MLLAGCTDRILVGNAFLTCAAKANSAEASVSSQELSALELDGLLAPSSSSYPSAHLKAVNDLCDILGVSTSWFTEKQMLGTFNLHDAAQKVLLP